MTRPYTSAAQSACAPRHRHANPAIVRIGSPLRPSVVHMTHSPRSKAASKYEPLIEYRSSHGPMVQQVRGSLIVSSLATLHELDLFDRYLSCLDPEHHDRILYILAASWVPVENALLHYGACEAMNLSESELDVIGRHVSQRIMGTFVGTLMRTASNVLMPGRVPLQQYPRLWERLMSGGSCGVYVCGANEARIESRGVPMFRYRYFRMAYTGLIRGAGSMFRSNLHARSRGATDDSLTIELSWS